MTRAYGTRARGVLPLVHEGVPAAFALDDVAAAVFDLVELVGASVVDLAPKVPEEAEDGSHGDCRSGAGAWRQARRGRKVMVSSALLPLIHSIPYHPIPYHGEIGQIRTSVGQQDICGQSADTLNVRYRNDYLLTRLNLVGYKGRTNATQKRHFRHADAGDISVHSDQPGGVLCAGG